MTQYRQGDILIIRRDAVPAVAGRLPGTTVVLGEATGHSHRFADESAVSLFLAVEGGMFADVHTRTTLVHEEHEAISIDPGVYEIRRRREFFTGREMPQIALND